MPDSRAAKDELRVGGGGRFKKLEHKLAAKGAKTKKRKHRITLGGKKGRR